MLSPIVLMCARSDMAKKTIVTAVFPSTKQHETANCSALGEGKVGRTRRGLAPDSVTEHMYKIKQHAWQYVSMLGSMRELV